MNIYLINKKTNKILVTTSNWCYDNREKLENYSVTTIGNLYKERGIPKSHISPIIGDMVNEYNSSYGRVYCWGVRSNYENFSEAYKTKESEDKLNDLYFQSTEIKWEDIDLSSQYYNFYDWVYYLKDGCHIVDGWDIEN